MSAKSDVDHGVLRYGEDGIEAEYWIDELSMSRPESLGASAARHRRVGEMVVGALEAGGNSADVVAALVMTGCARQVVRLRDRLPLIRALAQRYGKPQFELVDG